MATITITQDLSSGDSNLVSVHNFNKIMWTFVPTDDTKEITSKVKISINLTDYYFDGVQTNLNTATTPDTYSYELDVTEILKYAHYYDFYYKAVSAGLNSSNLVATTSITVYGYEDGSSTDNEVFSLSLSHGVNQIGYYYGSNMRYLFDMDKLTFNYFIGYPFELYFYLNTAYYNVTVSVEDIDNDDEDVDATLKTVSDTDFDELSIGSHDVEVYGSGVILTTHELIVNDGSCGGVYIRYLSREGFYRYWLFNKYWVRKSEQTKIGDVTSNIDTMVGALSRKNIIGYKDSYDSIDVISQNVSKENQEMLMDIFTSPAVYYYTGSEADQQDWVLVEVSGSHDIRNKKDFDIFRATIKLPENYTQTL